MKQVRFTALALSGSFFFFFLPFYSLCSDIYPLSAPGLSPSTASRKDYRLLEVDDSSKTQWGRCSTPQSAFKPAKQTTDVLQKRQRGGTEFLGGGESRASPAGKLSTRGRTVFPAHKLSTQGGAVWSVRAVLSTRMSLPAIQVKEPSRESLLANQLKEHSQESRILDFDPDIVSAPLRSGCSLCPERPTSNARRTLS